VIKDRPEWWTLTIEEACHKLQTDLRHGLSSAEANQRLRKHGLNKLPDPTPTSPFIIFLRQFSSFIVWVLIVAASIAALLGEWIDSSAILVIILLNAILGFIQEFRAEKSLAALRKLASPSSKVIRDGILRTIPSIEVVPGDLILFEAGDKIPADGRLVNSVHLSTQEASLTGESIPIYKTTHPIDQKNPPIGDRKNMAYMGTITSGGKGHLIVTETALETELGKIATLLKETKIETTPLQQRLTKLGQRLVFLCLIIVMIIFGYGLIRGLPLYEMLLTSLSLAVAAIPEGLPAVVTISLAFGVKKMVSKNALIRRLSSVETLGSATVICTDKTGTLTQNEMVVRNIWVNEQYIDVTGIGYIPEGAFEIDHKKIDPKSNPGLMLALRIGTLCNNANLLKKNGIWEIVGDPTEGAILVAAKKAGLTPQSLEVENPLIDEIPFDSERKRMTMLRKTEKGPLFFVKGAPDIILEHSQSILIDGKITPLTKEKKKEILLANQHLANKALRVLAVAYRESEMRKHIAVGSEENLVFVGLIAMMDPPRIEAKQAVATCKEAGIKTVMITGDHKDTGVAIAKELDMMPEGSEAINGHELDGLSDQELMDHVTKITVYARATAQHKIRIIQAWKKHGEIVAMTGDGINDAPAIKEADIGVSMGITGTDVTKEASDMVILDDNFASIVNAVEEGRGIYDNIMKFVRYLLTSNIAEILVIFFGMLLNLTDPQGNPFVALLPVQLLWINLVTDGFPAIALGVDPVDPTAMKRPPRDPHERILSNKVITRFFSISLFIAIGTILLCQKGLQVSGELGHTMAFTTLVIMELVKVQIIRRQYHIGFFSNGWLIAALISSLCLQLAVIYIPWLQVIFGTVPLGLNDWGCIGFVVVIVGILANLALKRR